MTRTKKYIDPFKRVMDIAYIRENKSLHTGEAMMLAVLLHAKGRGRESSDMKDVQRIMKDHNLEKEK